MKRKIATLLFALATLLPAFSCDDDLDNCYETVCYGPDNTNCVEEPVGDSGCFPNGNTEFKD